MNKSFSRLLAGSLAFIILLTTLPLTAHAATDVTAAFTDPAFLAVIRAELKKGDGAIITAEECATIITLFADNAGIESLAGIEHLKNLSALDCSDNELAELNLSSNPKLVRLVCGENPLTSLNIQQNTELTLLNCSDTLLPTLDVTKNRKLEILFIPGNPQITSLDLSYNTELTNLHVAECGFSSLDLSKNTKLKALYCQFNELTSLDISNLAALETLECSDNQLTSLNLTGCPYLMELSCANNNLTALNVSQNTILTWLVCSGNMLGSLNVSSNQFLLDLRCSNNNLTRLDITQNAGLEHLECADNRLNSLDLTMNKELVVLDCAGNYISSLDVSNNTLLYSLSCAANQIQSLDINGLSRLRELDVSNNKFPSQQAIAGLASANLYKLTYDPQTPNGTDITAAFTDANLLAALREALEKGERDPIMLEEALLITELRLNGKGIEALHGLEYFSNLTKLSLMDNALTQLDASCFPKLVELDCSSNQLTSLDVTGCMQLEKLWCSENQLERLDVTKNSKLNTLNCYENLLVSLDASQNPMMQQLICSYNLLSTLNLSQNSAVSHLDVRMNFLPEKDAVQLFATPDPFYFSPQRDLNADMSAYFTDANFLDALLEKLGKSAGDPITAAELQTINELNVSGRGIKSLAGLSFLSNLEILNCSDNKLTGFDIYANTALHTLDATLNWMISPDDVYNLRPEVTSLFQFTPQKFSGENVTAKFADAKLLAAVREALGKEPDGPVGSDDCAQQLSLNLQGKGIKNTAGLECFTGLKELNLSNNELSQLVLEQNKALTQLDVSGNHLRTLNLAPLLNLQSVNVSHNFMESQSAALRFSNPAPKEVIFEKQNKYEETKATCTTGGYGTWTCSHNPAHTLQVNDVHSLGHDYRSAPTNPTLASEGYTTYTCSRCLDSYIKDITPRVSFDYNNTLALRYHGNTTLFSDADHLASELTWKSSNEKVLKIDDNGLITFPRFGRGETIITGSANGVDYVTVNVTVKIEWWQWLIIVLLFGWIWY